MTFYIMQKEGVRDISSELLLPNGKLALVPAEYYKQYSWEEFRLFCHDYARYGIPTIELVEFIKNIIGNRNAIEIGAGHGDLGFHLGIPMTDSKLQDEPLVKSFYLMGGQPVIKYPKDVIKAEALMAVKKFKPKVVVGSWVTRWQHPDCFPAGQGSPFGIKERKLLSLVDTYIMIGNLDIHGDKPIIKIPHELIQKEWIVSRAKDPSKNVIMIWNRKK